MDTCDNSEYTVFLSHLGVDGEQSCAMSGLTLQLQLMQNSMGSNGRSFRILISAGQGQNIGEFLFPPPVYITARVRNRGKQKQQSRAFFYP